jgi:hypothetical protein
MAWTEEVIYTGEEFDFYGRASVADCESLDDLWKEKEWV